MVTQASVKVVGFGPPGLIEAVKKAEWKHAVPSGENFLGLALGGYLLTRPADELSSFGMEVTITCGEDQFTVRGWAFPGALEAAKCAAEKEGGSPVWGGPVKLAEIPLARESTQRNNTRYEIDIIPL